MVSTGEKMGRVASRVVRQLVKKVKFKITAEENYALAA